MILTVIFALLSIWGGSLLLLWIWKRPLFIKTWHEPYFGNPLILIESDDWGPGGDFHAQRLENLLDCLAKHKDGCNRSAVMTADVVLAVPDIDKTHNDPDGGYHRKILDQDFTEIYAAMQRGIQTGTLVPQLHGMEHLNGKAFAKLIRQGDSRLQQTQIDGTWWDWEALDSPLQGHYVDGSSLPTISISQDEARNIIVEAANTFKRLFGYASNTTVAPCYLWNDDIERLWKLNAIHTIQTAGYRCTGRDATGHYVQDPAILRSGEINSQGQCYLVRNVMYEPVDGKNTPESAFAEALSAYQQALPIIISTHRYNYTRGDEAFTRSLSGLDCLLNKLTRVLPDIRFLASPELGEIMHSPEQNVVNHFNQTNWPGLKQLSGAKKTSAFLFRLYYRHPKLALLSYLSGLIVPAYIFCHSNTQKVTA